MNDIDQDVRSLFILHNINFGFCIKGAGIEDHVVVRFMRKNDRITIYNGLNDISGEIDVFVDKGSHEFYKKFKTKERDNILEVVIRAIHEFIKGECKYCTVNAILF